MRAALYVIYGQLLNTQYGLFTRCFIANPKCPYFHFIKKKKLARKRHNECSHSSYKNKGVVGVIQVFAIHIKLFLPFIYHQKILFLKKAKLLLNSTLHLLISDLCRDYMTRL
jgi:hypothetical protein